MSAGSTCPTCGRTLDALRAPVARIVGGKVVAYCSAECTRGKPSIEIDTVLVDDVPEALPPPPLIVSAGDSAREGDITPLPATDPLSLPLRAPEEPVRRPRRRGRVLAAGLAAAALAAAGLLLTRGLAPPPPAPTPPPALTPIPIPSPPPPPVPEVLDRGKLLGSARATLVTAMQDPSPRMRLLAAMALSRSGDAAALAALGDALDKDPSEIRRLEVASALSRAADARGTDYLLAALKSTRRDVRLEAARALALLGDARGRDRLHEALDVVQLRLGAAENLAALGDPQALAILKQALAGKVDESRLRAAVALGRAGDDSGRDVLHQLLAESRLEIGAEDALARLGDRAALPALTRALGLSALRVQAALDLRRLGADPDLTPLATALAAEDPVGKISAAEASLVLLLPLSERR